MPRDVSSTRPLPQPCLDGQTDEAEMGMTYAELDSYLLGGTIAEDKKQIADRMHRKSEHKRSGVRSFAGGQRMER